MEVSWSSPHTFSLSIPPWDALMKLPEDVLLREPYGQPRSALTVGDPSPPAPARIVQVLGPSATRRLVRALVRSRLRLIGLSLIVGPMASDDAARRCSKCPVPSHVARDTAHRSTFEAALRLHRTAARDRCERQGWDCKNARHGRSSAEVVCWSTRRVITSFQAEQHRSGVPSLTAGTPARRAGSGSAM